MPDSHRCWLITGCSTGLGRALAEVLIGRGERVFADGSEARAARRPRRRSR